MVNKENSTHRNASIVLAAVNVFLIVNATVFAGLVVASDDAVKVTYIPDDGYYYLVLAINYVKEGFWTFDGGISATSGYHPLFAWILSGMAAACGPSWSGLDEAAVVAMFVLYAGMYCYTVYYLFQQRDLAGLLSAGIIGSSYMVLVNSISMTEWSLVVLSAALYYFVYYRVLRYRGVFLFLLGILGSLARSDYGIVPLAVLMSTVLIKKSARINVIRNDLLGLVGAGVGVLLVMYSNFHYTGDILQFSALMKRHWYSIAGATPLDTWALLKGVTGGEALSTRVRYVIVAMVFVGILVGILRYRRRIFTESSHIILHSSIASSAVILGYALLYSHNGAVQIWYSSALIVLVFLLIRNGIHVLILGTRSMFVIIPPLVIFVVVSVRTIPNLYPVGGSSAKWKHAAMVLPAAKYIRDHLPYARVASWNAGALSYYSSQRLVNLDGLVNNDVYSYVVGDSLPAYLESRSIDYIVDTHVMITDPAMQVRGGYGSVETTDWLRHVATLSDTTSFGAMQLYSVVRYARK